VGTVISPLQTGVKVVYNITEKNMPIGGKEREVVHLVCEECGKRYDYAVDDFCPRCGAFNPPKKTWGVDASGNVVRVDGVNEANHRGSFVHAEVHKEKFQRRVTGLDRDQLSRAAVKKPPVSRPVSSRPGERKRGSASIGVLVLVLFALQLIRSCASIF